MEEIEKLQSAHHSMMIPTIDIATTNIARVNYVSGILSFDVFFEDGIQARQLVGQCKISLNEVASRGGEVSERLELASPMLSVDSSNNVRKPHLNVKIALYNHFI